MEVIWGRFAVFTIKCDGQFQQNKPYPSSDMWVYPWQLITEFTQDREQSLTSNCGNGLETTWLTTSKNAVKLTCIYGKTCWAWRLRVKNFHAASAFTKSPGMAQQSKRQCHESGIKKHFWYSGIPTLP